MTVIRNGNTIVRAIDNKPRAYEGISARIIPDFYDEALCPQVDTDGFFPAKGQSTKEAKATCLKCPVRDECLEWALENDERWGVWGGKSERERHKIKSDRKRAANAAKAGADEGSAA